MASDAKAIAKAISDQHLKFGVGQIEFWGAAAVRPNDVVYPIVSATADGDKLVIAFEDAGDGGGPITVHAPTGFKQDQRSITIQGAARITWTAYKGAAWDAVLAGNKVKLTAPATGTHERDAGESPALHLVG